jgi:hypothetical protein
MGARAPWSHGSLTLRLWWPPQAGPHRPTTAGAAGAHACPCPCPAATPTHLLEVDQVQHAFVRETVVLDAFVGERHFVFDHQDHLRHVESEPSQAREASAGLAQDLDAAAAPRLPQPIAAEPIAANWPRQPITK